MGSRLTSRLIFLLLTAIYSIYGNIIYIGNNSCTHKCKLYIVTTLLPQFQLNFMAGEKSAWFTKLLSRISQLLEVRPFDINLEKIKVKEVM